jgi:hypothetical protein
MPRRSFIILAILILLAALAAGYSFVQQSRFSSVPGPRLQTEREGFDGTVQEKPKETVVPVLATPLSEARSRVTKKPFGLRVSPGNSPVSPERFSGYHTGVDFEIRPGEEGRDVPVRAVCTGPVAYANRVGGYGGVLVQRCTLAGQQVTVLYGHLRLASIRKKAGENLAAGEQLGVLGKGYGAETDGERKHLHLGIHQGYGVELRGYVRTQSELRAWRNPLEYLP